MIFSTSGHDRKYQISLPVYKTIGLLHRIVVLFTKSISEISDLKMLTSGLNPKYPILLPVNENRGHWDRIEVFSKCYLMKEWIYHNWFGWYRLFCVWNSLIETSFFLANVTIWSSFTYFIEKNGFLGFEWYWNRQDIPTQTWSITWKNACYSPRISKYLFRVISIPSPNESLRSDNVFNLCKYWYNIIFNRFIIYKDDNLFRKPN